MRNSTLLVKRTVFFYCVVLCGMLLGVKGWAQPYYLGTDITGSYNNYTASIPVMDFFKQQRVQETVSTASGTRKWEWNADSYFNTWRAASAGQVISSYNATIPPNVGTASAYWRNNSGGTGGFLPATTAGNYYTFNVTYNGNQYRNEYMSVLETSFNPVTISTVSQTAGTYGSAKINITTSATPASGEYIYLRYSTTSTFTSSTIVQATGSGTAWSANIPWQSSTVYYYVYTSNRTATTINTEVGTYGQAVHDMSTLNLKNNSGTNFIFSPAAGPIIVSSAGGTFASPISYTSLTNAGGAFTAINSAVSGTGAITILITGDVTTEAGTNALNASANWTSIGVNPSGARTISGTSTAGLPLFDLNGADNVTIDGLSLTGSNTLTLSNLSTSSTSGTSTIRFQTDATNNTITNCSVLGSSTVAVGSNGGNIWFGSAAISTGNDGNTISNCNIGPAGANLPTKCIYFSGSSNTDPGTANSGIVINNNNIYDYFSSTLSSYGIDLNSGSVNLSITNNRFYQTATRTQTSTGLNHRAISINNTSGNSYIVTGNTIGYATNASTGTYTFVFPSTSSASFIPIYISVGSTITTSIQGNTIANIAISGGASGTSTSAPFRGIYVAAGLTTIGNTTGNTIGNLSATGSITYTSSSTSSSDVIGIYNFGSDNWTTSNNSIGGFTVANSSTGATNFYGLRCNTSSSVTWTCTSNTIGGTVANSINSTSTATGTIVNGILNSSPIGTFTSNIIRNMTVAGGTGTTTSASMVGICISASSANQTISQNTISSLSNSNASAATIVTGIQFTGSTANVVERNFIYGLTSSTNSTSAEINGIRVAGGTTIYRNNMIALGAGVSNALGSAATNSSTAGINGINEFLGTDQFFHNSVYIGGTATSGSGASFAFNGTQTVNTRSFRDNIFVNARSNSSATGKNYAVKINGTVANPTGLTINNNIYYANGTGGVFGFFNSLDVASLAAWQTAVGQDANSYYSDPQYQSPAASTPDLHINPSVATVAEGNGVDVGVTNDYDGQTRASFTPVDIGADAGNFIALDLTGPAITYTALSNACGTGARTLTATITDASGVPTSGIGLPVLYWKINSGAYASATGTFVSGNTYSFTFGAGAVTGDVVSYYIAAQDNASTPNITTNPLTGAGGFSANPPKASTPPTSPSSYTITATLSGTYTVGGASPNYPTLTAAVNAYNNSCLGGAVTFILQSGYTSTGETFPITINANTNASNTNTLTIKPAVTGLSISASLASAASAVIILNGADYVTIDGSITNTANTVCPASSASRDLTITNLNTSTSSAVVWLQTTSGSDAATNNTIKNCVIIGNSSTTTLIGVGSGGPRISSTSLGTGNNNNSYINNSISKVQFGIYSQGATAVNKNTGTIINQNLMNAASPNISRGGILTGFENGIVISGNNIANISGTSSNDAIAISLGTSGVLYSSITGNEVTNATISKNYISSVRAASTYSAIGIAVVTTANTGTNIIANNMINDVLANGTASDFGASIFIGGGTSGTNVYYNTINMAGTITGGSYDNFGIAVAGSNPTVDLRNNIVVNTSTSGTGFSYALGFAYSTYTNLTSNYNDLYVTGTTKLIRVGSLSSASGTDYGTLAAWTGASGKDANSQNVLPVFVSVTDLHLNTTNSSNISNLNAKATPVTITDDIDCATRDASIPDIGADEFTSANPPVINSTTLNTPANCTAIAHNVTANITAGASPITNVTVAYSFNGSPTGTVAMTGGTTTGTSNWTATIPAATPANALVTWSVTATDGTLTAGPVSGTSYQDATLTSVTATVSATRVCSGTAVTLTASAGSLSYCTPSYGAYDGTDYISKVELLNSAGTTTLYSRTSGATILPCYDNETALTTTTLTGGTTYNLRVTNGGSLSEYIAVFIDYNSDGVLTGTGETLLASTSVASGSTTGLVAFTVPSSAYNGTARLRFVLSYFSAATSCINSATEYGETEDYNVIISGATTNPNGITSYTWKDDLNNTVGTGNPLTINPTATHSYTVTVINGSNCSTTSNAVTVTIVSPLAGVYSVGSGNVSGEAGHYNTLTAAAADYNSLCLGGAITFVLTDATYTTTNETFPISFGNAAASSTNTLIISPSSASVKTITGSVSSNALIKILGNYITIDGSYNSGTTNYIAITNTSATSPVCVLFGSTGTTAINNDALKYCTITNGSSTNTSASAVLLSDATTLFATGYFNNITIQNNTVQKSYFGIDATLAASGTNGNGLIISNNLLNSTGSNQIGRVGVYLEGVYGATISGNTIGNFETATSEYDEGIWLASGTTNITVSGNNISGLGYTGGSSAVAPDGIYISSVVTAANILITDNVISNISTSGATYVTGIDIGPFATAGVTITKNNISNVFNTYSLGYGAGGIVLESTSTTANTSVSNNFILNVYGYGYASGAGINDNGYGIIVNAGAGYKIYYNTVNLATNQTASGAISAAINITSGVTVSGAIDLRNNIFVSTQTSGTRYAIYSGASSIVYSTINYNDYYSAGTNLGYIGGSARANIAAWRTGTSQDVNSVNIQPVFVSATDLHLDLSNNTTLDNLGTQISGITTDIDADIRSTFTPDMGADEFTSCSSTYAVWLGGTDQYWNTNTNWCNSTVPNSNSVDVYIKNTTNKPMLQSSVSVRNLDIINNAWVNLSNYNLTIGGALNTGVTSPGTFKGSTTSGLTLSGGTGGTAYFDASTNTLKTLTVGTSGTALTLGNALNITPGNSGTGYGTVSVTGGTIASGGYLTLKSDVNGTARVDGAGTSTGSITGIVTVERYIPARRAWRFLGVPFSSSSQYIRDAWQEGVNNYALGLGNNLNPNSGYGTHITGNNNSLLGFDFNTTTNPSMKVWDAATGAWSLSEPATASTSMDAYKAYCLFVRGSRAVDLSAGTSATADPTVLRAKGALNEPGGNAATITYTGGTNKIIFVGNPFASSIDITNLLGGRSPGIDNNKFWVWDPKITGPGTYNVGGYVAYSNGVIAPSSSPSYSNAGSTLLVQSGQAFMVQLSTSSTSASMKFQQDDKTASEANVFGKQAHPVYPIVYTNLVVPSGDSLPLVDGVSSVFDNKFSTAVDANDAQKVWNFDENIALVRDAKTLAIEFRPMPKYNDTIFYRLYLRQQPYALKIFSENMRENIKGRAWLVDKYLDTKTEVNLSDTTLYNFTPNTDTNSYRNRFMLVYERTGGRVTASSKDKNSGAVADVTAFPNPVTKHVFTLRLTNIKTGNYHAFIYDTKGNIIADKLIVHNGKNAGYKITLPSGIAAGMYKLVLNNDEKNLVQSISLVVAD